MLVHKRRLGAFTLALLAVLCRLLLGSGDAAAHTAEDGVLAGVGVDERLGAAIPLDLAFTDQDGKQVRLGDYFTGQPVILTLNYYECPMLCPLQFRNLVATMNGIRGLSLDRDFRIVTVSINPEEPPEIVRQKWDESHALLRGVADPASRWPFLSGREPEIARLTGAVGFRYVKLGPANFAHPSVIILLTPQGKVARYLYGMEIPPQDLKLALIEAAGGKIGGSTLLNQLILSCYHYDPVGKKYVLAAVRIMNTAAATVGLLLGGLLFALWRREKRRKSGGTG